MTISRDPAGRATRIIFCVLMLTAWSGGPTTVGTARAAEPSNNSPNNSPNNPPNNPPNNSADAKMHVAADQFDQVISQLKQSEAQIPRDSFDLAAVIRPIGDKPADLLQWVKTNTRWVPYHGVLRGTQGVLMDRRGDSLDRALLVGSMMEAARKPVRLAHCQLTEEQGRAALTAMAAAPSATQPDATPVDDTAMADYAKAHQLDPQQLKRDLAKFTLPADTITDAVVQHVADQIPMVLSNAGKPSAPAVDAALDAVCDHWWVQYQDGDNWVDADPAGIASDSIKPQLTVKGDISMGQGEFALDPANYHLLQFRVIGEQSKDGKRTTNVLLDQSIHCYKSLGQSITFIQTPMGWPGDYNPLAGGDAVGQFRTNVLAVKEWVPALKVGSELVQQHGITENGNLDLKPNLDSMAGSGKAAGGAAKNVSDILGGMDAASPATPPPPTGVFTAEWVEYSITGPGIKPHTERRTLFDLIGDTARKSDVSKSLTLTDDQRLDRGVALSETVQLLPLTCQLSSEFVQHLAISNLVDNQNALSGCIRTAATDTKKSWDQLVTMTPFPGQVLNWALARPAVSRVGSSMFLNQLNVVALRNQIRRSPANEYSQRLTLDIISNPVAFAASAGDPFAAAVEQGVVDTNLETAVMPNETPFLKVHYGTADLMSQSKVQGVNWAVVKPNAKPDWNAASVPSDAQAMMSQELAEGYLVLAPDKPVAINSIPEFGWWRIDPVTGQSLGMTTAGGAAMVERALLFVVFLATWANNVMGCGGFAPGASSNKKLGCAACGAASAALSTLALGAAFGFGALSVAGKVASGAAGAAGSSVTGSICNGISAGMD